MALGKTGDRKILPLLEALREGSVYVRSAPRRQEGDRHRRRQGHRGRQDPGARSSRAYGREPIAGPDGKPLLADLTTLEEVSTGRSLRIAIRPLIDAFSGQSDLVNPDPATRRAAATKMGYTGDASTLQAARGRARRRRRDRWVRFALEEARRPDPPAHRRTRPSAWPRPRRSGGCAAPTRWSRSTRSRAIAQAPAPLAAAARVAVKRIERWGLFTQAHRDRLPGPLAVLDPAAHGPGPRHRVRADGRHQHGPRRADGARRLRHVPDAGLVRRPLPGDFDYYFLVALPFSFLVAAAAGLPARARA